MSNLDPVNSKIVLFDESVNLSSDFVKLLKELRLRVPDKSRKRQHETKFMQTIDFSQQIISWVKKIKRPITILDCACGNSYLSFVLYYLLTEVYNKQVHIIGVDLQEPLIKKCNAISKEKGYTGLEFMSGNIDEFTSEREIDVVYSLHACDVATDYAIAKAIKLGAKAGFFVSCCHNQISNQVQLENFPFFAELLRNRPFKEKIRAFVTDTVRQLALEGYNYKTKIFEFTPVRWTDKNIMIKAILTGKPEQSPKIENYKAFLERRKLNSILTELLEI
ncbi:MAG: class I SAM-dependent methyltransferase [Candidatus Hodarchaeales archaeon]|jgi:SAM-dependent methyltransferase